MRFIKDWLVNKLIKHYLEDFYVVDPDKRLSDGEWAGAMNDVYVSEALNKLITIRVANLIRRNLYSNDLIESALWKGQILSLRWLQNAAKGWVNEQKGPEKEELS